MRPSSAVKTINAGVVEPPGFDQPASGSSRFVTTSSVAITAATVTAVGRSPSRSGSSLARASAFFSSERERAFTWTSPAAAARARFLALLDTQPGFQRRCDGTRIVGVADGSDDHRPSRASRNDLADVLLVDASDGEPRLGRVRGRVADVVEPGRGPSRLRWGLPDGADAQVVGVACKPCLQLLRRMGRQADEYIRPDQPPHGVDGQVVLADVDAVRACLQCDLGPVVDHEERVVKVTRLAE